MILSSINVSFGAYSKAPPSPLGPTVNDDNLTVEKIAGGLKFPTSMAFIGNNDILVTEKSTGRVMEVKNGQIQPTPALDVQVASAVERGLLGIDVSKHPDGITYAFIYYTQSGGGEDGDDFKLGVEPAGNMLYRYEYVNGKLINPSQLLDLPANPGITNRSDHVGGKVVVGPDNNVYLGVGEVGGHRTLAQNNVNGSAADGTSGILRLTQNSQVVDDGDPIFGENLPLSIYYAMGIRNSFGMDFDPLTGNLWDTENGPIGADEINLVEPGFNSGWALIQGDESDNIMDNGASENDLVELGEGQYSDPEFVWEFPIGVTALKFLNSGKLGNEYANNMFVGDINNGLLYRFTLNEDRDEIFINDTYVGNIELLEDNEVDETPENAVITFGQGFGGITDIQVGPDGYLYVLSFTGDIYRILPTSENNTSKNQPIAIMNSSSANQNATLKGNYTPAVIVGIDGDESYSPNPIEISVGQTVSWFNGDAISHTVTSGEVDDPDEGVLFESGAIIPYADYSLTFSEPGEFDYYCIYHPTMVGEIIVNSTDAAAPESLAPQNDESSGDESSGDESSGDESSGDESSGDESSGDESSGDESSGDESSGDES